jgi:Rod binding domain-containing protein
MSLAIGDALARNVALALTGDTTRTAAPVASARQPAGKAEHAARDFEAVMLAELLEPLEKSFGGGLDNGTAGSADYGAMGTQALATAMAERGGIGIARLVLCHLGDTKVPTSKGTGVRVRV